jgi:hypothetical protein
MPVKVRAMLMAMKTVKRIPWPADVKPGTFLMKMRRVVLVNSVSEPR